jgi:DNA-binding transcriptional ArsR family regulator
MALLLALAIKTLPGLTEIITQMCLGSLLWRIMETTTTLNEFALEVANFKEAALVFRAVNHKLRQQILAVIHENKGIDVTSIYRKLGLEQSVASQHLAILRKARIVTTKREQRFVYYSVNYERLGEIGEIAKGLLRKSVDAG